MVSLRCLAWTAFLGCGIAQPLALRRIIDTLLPAEAAQALIFIKAQSAFVREESIALSDQIASLVEAYNEINSTVVAVPGSYWVDAAAGKVFIVGVSAVFQVGNASLVPGGIPTIGAVIPSSTVLGQPNIPGRFIGSGYTAFGAPSSTVPRRGLIEHSQRALARDGPTAATLPARRHVLSSEEAARAADEGFITDLLSMLPAPMRSKVMALLSSHNFTLASPQLPPNVLSSAVIGYFDIEFSVRPLFLSNQRSSSTRIAQTNRFGTDGTIANGLLFAPTLTAFVTTTVQQLAAAAAVAFNVGASLLQRNKTAVAEQARGQVAALQEYLGVQFGPLPVAVTLEFDVLFRAQLSVNDGDIASVI